MTTGKPDFNLNSFGIKYLSKDEVQEFLEKKINAAGNYEYEPPTGADQAALATERDKKGTGEKLSETGRNLVTPVTPKVTEKPAVADSKTRSHFNSETYGYEGQQIKPLHGTGDKDKRGNRPKITEKPSVTKKPDEGELPPISYKNERTGHTSSGSNFKTGRPEGSLASQTSGVEIQTGSGSGKTPESIEAAAAKELGTKDRRTTRDRKGQESPKK